MGAVWEDDLTRRTVLRLGLAGAALAAIPWAARRAEAAATPHFLVTLIGDGGWDTVQVLDVYDPADATDGVDVDNPGQPPSLIASVGGLTYVSNPVTRPMIDTYFANWASKT